MKGHLTLPNLRPPLPAYLNRSSLSLCFSPQVSSAIKLVQSDLGHAVVLPHKASSVQTATRCPRTANRDPFPASTSNWQTGHEYNVCAAAITGNGSKHWQMDSTQLGVSPQWRFCRLLDIQKLFIFKMKRWQFVYFAALWFLNKAFGSQTESVPIWRMGAVGGEDGIYFSFLTQGLFSCLSPRSRSPFSTGLNLSPGGCARVGAVLFHRWHLNDGWSHFARGIKTFTTAYAVVGSWI